MLPFALLAPAPPPAPPNLCIPKRTELLKEVQKIINSLTTVSARTMIHIHAGSGPGCRAKSPLVLFTLYCIRYHAHGVCCLKPTWGVVALAPPPRTAGQCCCPPPCGTILSSVVPAQVAGRTEATLVAEVPGITTDCDLIPIPTLMLARLPSFVVMAWAVVESLTSLRIFPLNVES